MKRPLWIALAILALLGLVWLLFHRPIKRWIKGTPPASTGLFQDPEGLAIDGAGLVYVNDEDRGTLTVLAPDGKVLKTVREIEGRLILHGDSLVARSLKQVFVIGEHELFELDLSETPRIVRQFGRRGRGDGEFEDPEGVCVDRQGRLWATDEDNLRILCFDPEGRFLRALPVGAQPESVTALPDGRLLVSFSKDNFCGAFEESGNSINSWDWGRDAGLRNPDFIAVDSAGSLYVTDQKNHRIQVFDKDFKPMRTFGSRGSAPGQFESPEDLAFDKEGNLWVADGGNHRVQVLRPDGTFVREIR